MVVANSVSFAGTEKGLVCLLRRRVCTSYYLAARPDTSTIMCPFWEWRRLPNQKYRLATDAILVDLVPKTIFTTQTEPCYSEPLRLTLVVASPRRWLCVIMTHPSLVSWYELWYHSDEHASIFMGQGIFVRRRTYDTRGPLVPWILAIHGDGPISSTPTECGMAFMIWALVGDKNDSSHHGLSLSHCKVWWQVCRTGSRVISKECGDGKPTQTSLFL